MHLSVGLCGQRPGVVKCMFRGIVGVDSGDTQGAEI